MLALQSQQSRQVVQARCDVRMIFSQMLFNNRQAAAIERLGLCILALRLQQCCQVVQARRNLGMIRAISFFINRQAAAIEQFGFLVLRTSMQISSSLIQQEAHCFQRHFVFLCKLGGQEAVPQPLTADWPGTHSIAVIGKHFCEHGHDCFHPLRLFFLRKPVARHGLHQTMEAERLGRGFEQRVLSQGHDGFIKSQLIYERRERGRLSLRLLHALPQTFARNFFRAKKGAQVKQRSGA